MAHGHPCRQPNTPFGAAATATRPLQTFMHNGGYRTSSLEQGQLQNVTAERWHLGPDRRLRAACQWRVHRSQAAQNGRSGAVYPALSFLRTSMLCLQRRRVGGSQDRAVAWPARVGVPAPDADSGSGPRRSGPDRRLGSRRALHDPSHGRSCRPCDTRVRRCGGGRRGPIRPYPSGARGGHRSCGTGGPRARKANPAGLA